MTLEEVAKKLGKGTPKSEIFALISLFSKNSHHIKTLLSERTDILAEQDSS